MGTEDLNIRDLEARVAERKAFLLKLTDFAEDFIEEKGRIVYRRMHSYHTKVRWELKNFGGFNILYESGYSMMGGVRS